MIKSFKFKDTEESKLFISGCTHLNHKCENWETPLWKLRGYSSAEEMTREIIKKINETCRQSDYLMILGDFCLTTTINEFWSIIDRINPHILMIRGNHNNPWEKEYLKFCEDKFGYETVGAWWGREGIGVGNIQYLGDYVEMIWNKQSCVCFHYPVMTHNYAKHDCWMLHSHNHNRYYPSMPTTTDEGKLLECGWDTFGKPVGFDEIKRIMDNKPYKKRDDHH